MVASAKSHSIQSADDGQLKENADKLNQYNTVAFLAHNFPLRTAISKRLAVTCDHTETNISSCSSTDLDAVFAFKNDPHFLIATLHVGMKRLKSLRDFSAMNVKTFLQYQHLHTDKQESHAVAGKPPHDAVYVCLHPTTLRLLLFYVHCIKADLNVKL